MRANSNAAFKARAMIQSRGFRLVIAGVLVAIIYPQARLLWFFLIALGYFWPFVDGLYIAWKKEKIMAAWEYARERTPFLFYVITLFLVFGLLFFFAQLDLYDTRLSFDEFREHELTGKFSFDRDRLYKGKSWGLRGPVVVGIRFAEGRILDDPETDFVEGIELIEHSDSVSVGRQGMEEMARRVSRANREGKNIAEVDAVSGATHSSLGLREAVIDALWGQNGNSGLNPISKAIFFLIGNDFSRFVFSASAVIFIVALFFEFCLGPFLRKDAGVTLPCYNCQTCVGVCPVKMVEEQPYPMTMVLETRLGNYKRAAELANYCVGCSNCASRCPVGLSGPMVGAEAIRLSREEEGKSEDD